MKTEKVKMVIGGRDALVDADQVKKIVKKQLIVARLKELDQKFREETDPVCKNLIRNAITEKMIEMKRLRIRQNVQFI